MIPRDTMLYIYEVRGIAGADFHDPPSSFVGIWNEEEFSYLFFTAPEDDYVNNSVCLEGVTLTGRHEMTYKDWQTGLPLQGITVGGIHFVPEDHPCPPAGALLLDPSVVFGDGDHPTTVACLGFLEELICNNRVASMLDLGTGSGILALAAARMGVKKVVAVDRNRLACETARYNVEINSLKSIIDVREGEARLFIHESFDLVAANLPFQVLRDLIPLRATGLHRFWVISGINAEQGGVLKELLQEQGYEIRDEQRNNPWVTFVAAKEEQ
jgi:ribosomal protein L11 methyltransferase